jgi:CAAX protease family protein
MSNLPDDQFPEPADWSQDSPTVLHHDQAALQETPSPVSAAPQALPEATETAFAPPLAPAGEQPIFQSWSQSAPVRYARIPNFGHLCLLFLLGLIGLAAAIAVLFVLSQLHVPGFNLLSKAEPNAQLILVSEGVLYLVTFGVSLIVFPLLWNENFFTGIQWRGSAALRKLWPLVGTAVGCFVLAMLDGVLMPGPSNAPIEKVFKTAGSAWMMLGFGITMAPFFEEMLFRGFILPSLCTAWDWTGEKLTHKARAPLDANGHPQWSMPAMIFGAILTSLPFAGLHVAQQGHSLGPFLLLIVISLILCTVRLKTRSLAASTMVHACYNFCIFAVTFVQTSGFKHLDKM